MRTLVLVMFLASSLLAADPVPQVDHNATFRTAWKIDPEDIVIPNPALQPVYPAKAIEAKVGAVVLVRAKVARNGEVKSAEIAYSTDSLMGFNEASLDAVLKANLPSRRPRTVYIPFVFTLDYSAHGTWPAEDEFVPVEVAPEMIEESTPEYPRLVKQAGLEGIVWIKALVDVDGHVPMALVHKSCGDARLDKAALDAAYKNRFNPAIQKGKPVACWVTYKIVFSLSTR